MNILLSNDDGINAPGMDALIRGLIKKHKVFVSAPSTQKSSISRAVSIGIPVRVEKRTMQAFPQVTAFAVDGTPVDCVRIALGNLIHVKIDLCMTGINFGHNIGTDTLYSGTAAAALEAAVNGIPAVALSLGLENHGSHYDTAAEVALRMVDFCKRHPLPRGAFYNVNIPDVPASNLKGAKITTLSDIPYDLKYLETEDNLGNRYYTTPWDKDPETEPDTDRSAVLDGFVAISALIFDNENNSLFGAVDQEELNQIGGIG